MGAGWIVLLRNENKTYLSMLYTIGGLHDYSNRRWAGLINDFYKPRWRKWLDNRIKELKNEPFEENSNPFEWEWSWVRNGKSYPADAHKTDIYDIADKLL